MLHFHASIHARPAEARPGAILEISGQRVQTLDIPPAALGATPFGCSFEEALAELTRLERMYVELDGSLVWVSSQTSAPWQVDGAVYDHDKRVLVVDIKGSCPSEEFDRFLHAFGWPETAVVFQLTRAAVFLDEAEFRRFAERAVTS